MEKKGAAKVAKKKVEEVKSEVEKVLESTASKETAPKEQSVMEEQDRQKRVADCTLAVQKGLITPQQVLDALNIQIHENLNGKIGEILLEQ